MCVCEYIYTHISEIQQFLFWVYTQRIKRKVSKRYLYTHFYNDTIHNDQNIKVMQVSITKWIGKQNVLYTYNRILCIVKKEILTHVTAWMNLEGIILSEISHSQKDKYCMISLIWGVSQVVRFIEKVEWWLSGARRR